MQDLQKQQQSSRKKNNSSLDNKSEYQLQKASQEEAEVYFDGLCQPYNPGGIACYAYLIQQYSHKESKKVIIHSDHGLATEPFSRHSSNNVAEYTALIKALEWLILNNYNSRNRNNKVIVRGDSQLVIYQIKGKYKVRKSYIVTLYQRANDLISCFKNIEFEWVPRHKNTHADTLSIQAYQEFIERGIYKNNTTVYTEKIYPFMATENQVKLLKNLGINPARYISKMEASRLISKALVDRSLE
ncbi:MAG TPA: ribonuclease HI [Nitrososphaeraceae archaeon]